MAKHNKCPHCSHSCRVRSSKDISETTREKYYICQNEKCGYIYRTVEQIVSSVLGSKNPNPKVNIPFGPQGKHRAQAPQPPT